MYVPYLGQGSQNLQTVPSSRLLQGTSPLSCNHLRSLWHFLTLLTLIHQDLPSPLKLQDVLWWERKYQKNTRMSLNALNEERHESWGERESFDFSFCPLLLVSSTAIWAGPPPHTLYLSICLSCPPDPYAGNSVPWLIAILPQCLQCLPNCSPFPPLLWLFPCHWWVQLQFPMTRILMSCALCCSLALTAWKVAAVNTQALFCVPHVFTSVQSCLGCKVLSRRGRRMGVSPPPSLSFRLLKQRMAVFMQTKIGSLNTCLHLSNNLLIIAAAVQEAALQNPELNMRCGSSL